MSIHDFIDDCQKLPLGKMREKYELIFSPSVQEIVDEAKKRPGGLNSLLMTWKGDMTDREPFYFIKVEDRYEVFGRSDRGGKEWLETFSNIEDATFDYFDRYLCELLCIAPDSKINAGYPESEYLKTLREEKRKKLIKK